MTAFNYFGVVKTSVVHTHIYAENVCKVDRSAHASFVRADDHEVIIVNMKTFYIIEESLDELIGRLDSFKTMQWSCVLYT